MSVVTLMNAAPEAFLEFGGHHASGGFSVREEAVHHLAETLQGAHQVLGSAAVVTKPYLVDLELTLDQISNQLLRAQRRCAPFGCANPKPLYLVRNVRPKEVVVFGKSKEHTKLVFETSGVAKEAIAFFRTPEEFSPKPTTETPCSLLVHLEESFFMNRLQTRLRIVAVID